MKNEVMNGKLGKVLRQACFTALFLCICTVFGIAGLMPAAAGEDPPGESHDYKYSYSAKCVCGMPNSGELTYTAVVPGIHATEINIFNDNEKRAVIRKQFVTLVEKGEAVGRERKVSETKVKEKPLVLPANGATMDDCFRIAELVYGWVPGDLSTMPLTIGFLKIMSTEELTVDAVYTSTDRDKRNISIDVERTPKKKAY